MSGGAPSNEAVEYHAIVGSREYPRAHYDLVEAFVATLAHLQRDHGRKIVVVSGFARGVDRFSATLAERMGLEVKEIKPEFDKYPSRYAPIARNTDIAATCTRLTGFWDWFSRGTADVVQKTVALHKPVVVFDQNGRLVPTSRLLPRLTYIINPSPHQAQPTAYSVQKESFA